MLMLMQIYMHTPHTCTHTTHTHTTTCIYYTCKHTHTTCTHAYTYNTHAHTTHMHTHSNLRQVNAVPELCSLLVTTGLCAQNTHMLDVFVTCVPSGSRVLSKAPTRRRVAGGERWD